MPVTLGRTYRIWMTRDRQLAVQSTAPSPDQLMLIPLSEQTEQMRFGVKPNENGWQLILEKGGRDIPLLTNLTREAQAHRAMSRLARVCRRGHSARGLGRWASAGAGLVVGALSVLVIPLILLFLGGQVPAKNANVALQSTAVPADSVASVPSLTTPDPVASLPPATPFDSCGAKTDPLGSPRGLTTNNGGQLPAAQNDPLAAALGPNATPQEQINRLRMVQDHFRTRLQNERPKLTDAQIKNVEEFIAFLAKQIAAREKGAAGSKTGTAPDKIESPISPISSSPTTWLEGILTKLPPPH